MRNQKSIFAALLATLTFAPAALAGLSPESAVDCTVESLTAKKVGLICGDEPFRHTVLRERLPEAFRDKLSQGQLVRFIMTDIEYKTAFAKGALKNEKRSRK